MSGGRRGAPAFAEQALPYLRRAAELRQAGRLADSIPPMREAARLDPRNAHTRHDLGLTLLQCGEAEAAIAVFDGAIALRPDFAEAHFRRGLALERLGRLDAATDAYRRAIALRPRLSPAHAALGNILQALGHRHDAITAFRRAATTGPDTTVGRVSMARALIIEGNAQKAEATLRRAIAHDKTSAVAHALLGDLVAEAGKAEEAIAAYEQAIALSPEQAGRYYDIVRARKLAESDRVLIARMLAADNPQLAPDERVRLHLAIGRAHDDLGDPEQAMRYYRSANRIKGEFCPLDRKAIEERVDWLISTINTQFLADYRDIGSDATMPVLILGMPRSGTTLVEQVLSAHPRVAAGGEILFWNRRGLLAREAVQAGRFADYARDTQAAYLAALSRVSKHHEFVTDKMPDNFFWTGLIHALFPKARIVHCRRDPLDVCVSVLSNYFAPRPEFSTEPESLVWYYQQYERLMAHWRELIPDNRLMELEYERLVAESETTIGRLLEFCGLEWDPACLQPERNTRAVSTASLWQVRQPINMGSVGRWRRYRPWLDIFQSMRAETS